MTLHLGPQWVMLDADLDAAPVTSGSARHASIMHGSQAMHALKAHMLLEHSLQGHNLALPRVIEPAHAPA